MKTLHLLRHAKAEPPGEDDPAAADHARRLAKRGQKAVALLGDHLVEAHFKVDRIFCSTAARARETLAPLRTVLTGTPVSYRDALYLIETDDLMEFLQALPEAAQSVLIVGHNPTFHDIALSLTAKAAEDESDSLRILKQKYPTGALCSIACDITRWKSLAPKCGTLTGFIRPRDLDD